MTTTPERVGTTTKTRTPRHTRTQDVVAEATTPVSATTAPPPASETIPPVAPDTPVTVAPVTAAPSLGAVTGGGGGGLSVPSMMPRDLPLFMALAYIALLTVAEMVTALIDPNLGLALHSLLLVVTLVIAAQWHAYPVSRLLIAIGFGPLIRILSLSLPLVGQSMSVWWAVVSIPLIVATYVAMQTLDLSWRDVGALSIGREKPKQRDGTSGGMRTLWWAFVVQLIISLMGLALGFAEYFILRPTPVVPAMTFPDAHIAFIVLLISTGFFEELLFRGVMQTVAEEEAMNLGPWTANFIVSMVFAALHIGYRSIPDYILVFVASMLFGWAFYKTRSLWGITIAHGLTNTMLFVILPHTIELPPIFLFPN